MTSSTAPPLLHVAPPLSRQASEAMDEDMVSDQFATDFLGALAVNEQSRYTMRYTSPVVESAYEASHWAHGRLRARNVLLGSALVYFAFAFSDIARFEDDYHVLLPLRYAAPRPSSLRPDIANRRRTHARLAVPRAPLPGTAWGQAGSGGPLSCPPSDAPPRTAPGPWKLVADLPSIAVTASATAPPPCLPPPRPDSRSALSPSWRPSRRTLGASGPSSPS